MSKTKLSFSLILALFLVGILSTVAFAKDPYGLKPYQTKDGLMVPFTNNKANGDTAATLYNLYLLEPDGSVKLTFSNLTAGSYLISSADLTSGKVYTLALTYADSAGLSASNTISSSTAVFTVTNNTFSQPALDTHGTGLINANQTGYNNTRKQRSGQKVHGFYENNTNSCASCHQTHTGADSNLLMKDGAYSTCATCHDGTMAAKNVWAPVDQSTVQGIAGTFNYTLNHNSSIHEADGTLQVSAAPGGNHTGTSQWTQQFDCASCHAAHGAGSNGENNLNFDPMGWGTVQYVATGTDDQKNGKLFKGIPIYEGKAAIPTTQTSPYILVRFAAAAADITTDITKTGYLYSRAGVKAGDQIIQTYRWNGSKGYVADFSLWLHNSGTTALFDSTNTDISSAAGITAVWKDGFAFGPNVANITSANVSLGIDVETTSNIRSLFDTTYVTKDASGNIIPNSSYIVDSGTEMSKYCSACHTDYLSATRRDTTGLYSSAHRHQTAVDKLTCVRCHYGHGSDGQIMKDANDNSYYDLTTAVGSTNATTGHAGSGLTSDQALSYLTDPNPSSALKRYTGMSVCYGCHGQGEVFKNNANNNPNAAGVVNGGSLITGQPGTR